MSRDSIGYAPFGVARAGRRMSGGLRVSIPLGRISAGAATLMNDDGLASYDVVRAATVIAAGADVIVTLDTGFALLPASRQTIYTDRSRLASCRAKRPRH